ncbi:1,6-dihydroxycyclohexa-2,4-diene-1-carboxylate dehydrogenase [Bordetella holmesii]|uniref:Short chain dehydrogenase family protein n=2 Tax=Bordetella holmesii TaxID=35814 RepID=A0ABP3BKX1_9BORD|nr:1,6-dihydroxycyclohexa-2,4-diene-1-carboxylate dehydrogenase [Bordetella holmesii]AHV91225.1 short chain dehydrogenase family protein [Bordetella holmesii ATCC 51541]AIT25787.1 short chain dehydrogenase family protein [Bordetella holmesii 44057]EWM44373.1 short chain dehydrogenase family protein [Bordetella holmesii 41130]EWM46353.1 short chain dehydrogenase family protein [Bordetella holmesii 35009]EWM50516.1 short chain dehydrogenase family protein [Bordetella holmesii 70147]
MNRFENQIALITGAAQGVGRATAARLAAEGASVVLVDRADDQGEAVARDIRAQGGQASFFHADLETHAGARAMVEYALDLHGRIDVSVHNVGGTIWMKPFWEYTPDEMQREVNRSLWPTLWSCREVIPVMRKQGRGAIVNVGSNATRGIYRVPYSASKGGVHAATVCMALELAESGVRVNCVSPGALDNGVRAIPRNTQPPSEQDQAWQREMYTDCLATTPMHRMGSMEEVAAAICFMAAPEASYITGQIMYVAGGHQD